MEKQGIEKMRDLVGKIRVGMMTTVGENGQLHSRPMWIQQMDFDGQLWFFTRRNAQKSHELAKDGRVLIAFSDPEEGSYVSVSGRAELLHDPLKAKELWNPLYETWFSQGLEDPELVLIQVSVDQADCWDFHGNQVVQVKMAG